LIEIEKFNIAFINKTLHFLIELIIAGICDNYISLSHSGNSILNEVLLRNDCDLYFINW